MSDTATTGSGLNVAEEYREHVARLIKTLSDADGALSALTAGQVDAVLDPPLPRRSC